MSKVEFVKLIGVPQDSMFIEGQYKVISKEEMVLLHLQIDEESPECRKMRGCNGTEQKDGFIRNKKDQEKLFRGEGKERKE